MYVQWQEMRSVCYNRNYDSVYILFIKKVRVRKWVENELINIKCIYNQWCTIRDSMFEHVS